MPNLTETIKQAAMLAMDAKDPASILFGKVKSVDPLLVEIDQKTILSSSFLLLTSNVKDHMVNMVDTGNREIKKYMINNRLLPGDKVLLFKQQGGQLYVVLDVLKEG